MAGLGLSGCAGSAPEAGEARSAPSYLGIETRMMDEELVQFRVALKGAEDPEAITDYAECAAAQYALIRGYGFARHVRTNVEEEGGIWSADAVYTISPALPEGFRTLDAEVVVADCTRTGIPTV